MKKHTPVMGEVLYVEYKERLHGGVEEDEESIIHQSWVSVVRRV